MVYECRSNEENPHLVEGAFQPDPAQDLRRLAVLRSAVLRSPAGAPAWASSLPMGSPPFGSDEENPHEENPHLVQEALNRGKLFSSLLSSASLGSPALDTASLTSDIQVPKAPVVLKEEFVKHFAGYIEAGGAFPMSSDQISGLMTQILLLAIQKVIDTTFAIMNI